MGSEVEDRRERKRRRLLAPEDGSYVLRPVIENVPLSAEDDGEDIHITAVEHWSKLFSAVCVTYTDIE